MLSQKQIAAACTAGAQTFDDGKTVFVEGVLYKVQKGAVRYKRMPAQKQNRKRLGIVLPSSAPVVAPTVPSGVKVLIGPAAHRTGFGSRRAVTADFIRHALRFAPAAKVKVTG